MYNSKEFVKSQLYISQDGKTAYLHSHDVVGHLEKGVEREEAFEQAVEIIKASGWIATNLEIETVEGGCTQHFERAKKITKAAIERAVNNDRPLPHPRANWGEEDEFVARVREVKYLYKSDFTNKKDLINKIYELLNK